MNTLELLLVAIAFFVGIGVGSEFVWWWMNREWQRNPYQFKLIVEEVIKLREARAKGKDGGQPNE